MVSLSVSSCLFLFISCLVLFYCSLQIIFVMFCLIFLNSNFVHSEIFFHHFFSVSCRLLPQVALTVDVCRNYRMKIAATRDRAEVLLRNQEKISSMSSLSTGMIRGDLLIVTEIINDQISSIIRPNCFFYPACLYFATSVLYCRHHNRTHFIYRQHGWQYSIKRKHEPSPSKINHSPTTDCCHDQSTKRDTFFFTSTLF